MCASALKAVNLGALLIGSGEAEVVVAGGMESMSRAPYLLEDQRFGARLGDRAAVDSVYRDGLCCPADGVLMGVHGSEVAAELGVSREQQDEWALRSQQRYAQALAEGRFAEEIVPVDCRGSRGGARTSSRDRTPPWRSWRRLRGRVRRRQHRHRGECARDQRRRQRGPADERRARPLPPG